MNAKTDISPDTTLDEFRKVVRSRRAVRRFTDDPLPDQVLDDCLDLAMLAPNSSNLQPWEFFVVRTPELKAQLAKVCLGQNAAKTAPVLIAVVARTDTWRKHSRMALEQWPEEKLPGIVEKYYSKIAPIHYNQGPFGMFGGVVCGPYQTGSPGALFTERNENLGHQVDSTGRRKPDAGACGPWL